MSIEEKDIISLNDGNDYSVVKIIKLPSNKTIYFVADIKNLTNNKFMYLRDEKLVEIEDNKLIEELKKIIVSNMDEINREINKSLELIDSLLD